MEYLETISYFLVLPTITGFGIAKIYDIYQKRKTDELDLKENSLEIKIKPKNSQSL